MKNRITNSPDNTGVDRWRLEDLGQPAWVHDAEDGSFLATNTAMVRAFGYTAEDLLGMRVSELLGARSDEEILFTETPRLSFACVSGFRHAEGGLRQVELSLREVEIEDRRAFLVLAVDVTSRRVAEDLLINSERQLAEAQRIAHLASFEWEIDSDEVRWSDELYRIYGLAPREFEATFEAFLARIHPDERGRVAETIRNTVTTGEPFRMEERIVRPDGSIRILDSRGQIITDAEGTRRLVGVCHDVTERKAIEAKIRHQALHDHLTGLPNRALLSDRLEHAVARVSHAVDGCLAVLVVEIDGFKVVNDNYGHAVGDLLLQKAAERLRLIVDESDTVARIGGDEFAVVIEDVESSGAALEIAERVRGAFNERFELGSFTLRITVSVGVSTWPSHGIEPLDLLRNADSAMDRAREVGGDSVRLFTAAMSERYRDRLAREEDLRQAVEADDIVNHYQPIVDGEGVIVGFESLARWQHPELGLVTPESFIPLAELTRLIIPLGNGVLRRGCRDLREWIAAGHSLRLSVNLSVRQFHDVNLLTTIDETLAELEVDPTLLELEVTETVAMQNVEFSSSILRQLRSRGISIAIDDFGAGQSSLIYLRQFPISTIKIDRVFVSSMLNDPAAEAIVRAIISLTRDLGLQVTAEGVETEAQAERLRELGCDRMQGYLFSRPVPAVEAMELLRSRSS